jgi:hypothetical protein
VLVQKNEDMTAVMTSFNLSSGSFCYTARLMNIGKRQTIFFYGKDVNIYIIEKVIFKIYCIIINNSKLLFFLKMI